MVAKCSDLNNIFLRRDDHLHCRTMVEMYQRPFLFLSASMHGKMLPFSFSFFCHICKTTICWDPEIVLPWQRTVTPFSLCCSGSRPSGRVQTAYMQPDLVQFIVITGVLPFTAVSCVQLVAIMMKVEHAVSLVANDYSYKILLAKSTEQNKSRSYWLRSNEKKKRKLIRLSFSLQSLLWYQYIVHLLTFRKFTAKEKF